MLKQIKELKKKQIVIVLIVLIVLLALIIPLGYQIRRIARQNQQQNTELRAERITEKLQDRIFFRIEHTLEIVSNNPELLTALQQNSSTENLAIRLQEIETVLNADTAYLMNQTGEVIAGTTYGETEETFVGNSYSFSSYFKEAMLGNNYTYGAVGITSQQRGFYFSTPVKQDNEIIGVLAVKIDLAEIDNILEDASDLIFLLSKEGVVFSSSDTRYLYNFFTEISNVCIDGVKGSVKFAQEEINPSDAKFEDDKALLNDKEYSYQFSDLEIRGWELLALREIEGLFYSPLYRYMFIIAAVIIIFLALIISGLLTNIFYRTNLEAKLRKFSKMVEQIPVSVIITDTKGAIEYVNQTFEEITGYDKAEVLGKKPNILKADKFDDEYYQKLWKTIKNKEFWTGEFYNQKKNGKYYWEDAKITPLLDKSGKIEAFIGVKEEITEEKELKKQLEFFAERDKLTKAYNRRFGYEILEQFKKNADNKGDLFTIVFIDINNLKFVNDNYGHNKGDELIVNIVEVVKSQIRDRDYLARFGGDEFIIVFAETDKKQAEKVLIRIQEKLKLINKEGEFEYHISISYSLAEYSLTEKPKIDELISRADKRMYQFKEEYKRKHDLKQRD